VDLVRPSKSITFNEPYRRVEIRSRELCFPERDVSLPSGCIFASWEVADLGLVRSLRGTGTGAWRFGTPLSLSLFLPHTKTAQPSTSSSFKSRVHCVQGMQGAQGTTFPFLHPTFPKMAELPVDPGPDVCMDLTASGWSPSDAGATTNRSFSRKFITAQPSAAESQTVVPRLSSLTRNLASAVMALNHLKLPDDYFATTSRGEHLKPKGLY